MAAYLSKDKLYAQAHNVGYKHHGQRHHKAIPPTFKHIATGTGGESMLITHVPHTKQAAGQQSQNHYYHSAFGVVAVVNLDPGF